VLAYSRLLLQGPNICNANICNANICKVFWISVLCITCAAKNLKYTTFITMASIIETVGTSSDNGPLRSGNVEVRLNRHYLEALQIL